ncbi:MAG: hypothetical protein UT00_C0008G0003 [Parcubacteria group bacterium GW2011_GWA1_38_7]|nr:MAG: hypothetical protein UT00_C0008G0003 [Parcubacteria group bacterium GW2011_GWA1_38_7]
MPDQIKRYQILETKKKLAKRSFEYRKEEKDSPTAIGIKARNRKTTKRVRIKNGWRRMSRRVFSSFSSPAKELSESIKIEKNDFIVYL